MTNAPRKKRSPPKRTKPHRTSAPAKTARATADGPDKNSAYLEAAVTDVEAAVSDALSDAVRLGYHVLAQNLEQGRTAAKQFRVGDYGARNVPADLSQLSQRMMRLARDLSLTTFDLLDRLMRDPAILTAARSMIAEAAGDETRPGQSMATRSDSSPRATPAAASAPGPFVSLTCAFPKGAKASTLTSWLLRPSSLTALTTTGLTTLTTDAAAIGGVTFRAAENGAGVIADVPIPKGQPAGLYSGAVVSVETGVALGTLTIQVGA